MRRVLGVILMMVVSVNLLFGQTQENKDMSFKVVQLNIGAINEMGGLRSAVFTFTNKGDKPIVINRISSSCGCTTVAYSRVPVMAGESSDIIVSYDPEFRPGFFDKKIYVYSNNSKSRNMLSLQGDVIARPKSIADTYPYNVGGGLLASSSYIDFGQIPVGYSHSLSLDIYNNTSKEMRIDLPRASSGDDYSYYITTPKLAAKSRGQIIVTFNLKESVKYAIYKRVLHIFVDGNRDKSSDIDVSAISVPDASKLTFKGDGVPAVFLPDVYHHFSSVYLGQTVTEVFKIENEGSSDLVIQQVILSDEDALRYTISSRVIKPLKSAELTIKFKPKNRVGRVNNQIILITNDPAYPVSEIRIAANIIEG